MIATKLHKLAEFGITDPLLAEMERAPKYVIAPDLLEIMTRDDVQRSILAMIEAGMLATGFSQRRGNRDAAQEPQSGAEAIAMGDLIKLKFRSPHMVEDAMSFIACRVCRNKTYVLMSDSPESFPLMKCAACGQHMGRMGWYHDEEQKP